MKFLPFVVASTLLFLSPIARADEGDKTLRLYLARATLVVAGEIISEPQLTRRGNGIADYYLRFKVSQLLAGTAPNSNELGVKISRYRFLETDRPGYLRKGSQCILFLRASSVKASREKVLWPWESADMWFGIQPYSPALSWSLMRLAGLADSIRPLLPGPYRRRPFEELSPAEQDKVGKAAKDDVDALVLRGGLAFLRYCGIQSEALHLYADALHLNPDHIRANLGMGEFLVWMSPLNLHTSIPNLKKAIPYLENVLQQAKSNSPESLHAKALLSFLRFWLANKDTK